MYKIKKFKYIKNSNFKKLDYILISYFFTEFSRNNANPQYLLAMKFMKNNGTPILPQTIKCEPSVALKLKKQTIEFNKIRKDTKKKKRIYFSEYMTQQILYLHLNKFFNLNKISKKTIIYDFFKKQQPSIFQNTFVSGANSKNNIYFFLIFSKILFNNYPVTRNNLSVNDYFLEISRFFQYFTAQDIKNLLDLDKELTKLTLNTESFLYEKLILFVQKNLDLNAMGYRIFTIF